MTHELVSISIEYPGEDKAVVKVDPEKVEIYYNRKKEPGDSKLARKVKWSVQGVEVGDQVFIRPKGSLDPTAKTIFKCPDGKKHFVATRTKSSIDCGPPTFDGDVPKPLHIEWEYEAVVVRADKEIGDCDPTILIEEDP